MAHWRIAVREIRRRPTTHTPRRPPSTSPFWLTKTTTTASAACAWIGLISTRFTTLSPYCMRSYFFFFCLFVCLSACLGRRPVAQLTQRQGFSNQDDDATRTPASEHPKDVKLDQDDNSTKFARAGSSANDAASTTISIPVMAADVSNSASSESSTSYFDSSSIRSSATEPTSAAEPQQ